MIKIIKGGKKRFVMICMVCDAKFSYEIDDVIGRTVRCPCCGAYCQHYTRNAEESEGEENDARH